MLPAHAQLLADLQTRATTGGLHVRFAGEGALVIVAPEEGAPPPSAEKPPSNDPPLG